MTAWTHKVVKAQRGIDGKWFRHPTSMTGTEAEATAYAERFAAKQAGVGGTRILVISRRGANVVRDIGVA